nr:SPOR domain-containing protein [Denitromonas sp.]
VFSTSENAQALYEKIAKMGIESHIESRVVVGPFKDRAAADAAREKLRKSGLGKGLVVRNP